MHSVSVIPSQSPTVSLFKDHREYWLERLEGAPGLLELPTDRPRSAVQSHRRASHRFSVMNGVVERLDSVARGEGATLFMTLLGAYQVLLHRYTGQGDLVVGTPIANRDRPEVPSMAGFFLNLLPVRTRVDGDETFRGLLGRLREGLMGDYAHAEYPFESMVEDLGLGRDASHAPLVQVAFVHLDQDPCGLELEGLEARREWVEGGTSKWDVLLSVEGRWDGGLECVLEYDRDLFDGARMERMAGHWRTLLEGIAADPGRRVWELPMLTAGEREQVLVEWNRTDREYPRDACLHRLFEEQALRTPEAVAVEFGEERLTYRELDGRANQLAHVLRRHGVGADSLVGVCMHRSVEMVVALYGVLKAGGAYVPIDPEYPADRIAFMLEDSATGVLLTQGALAGSLPRVAGHVICLDAGCAILDGESRAKPEEKAGPDSLAYMIYTSGSTGRPKGALMTHRGICNQLLWFQERYGLGGADAMLQKTPFGFDVSVWEFFWPLMVGARLVVARPGGHREADYLVEVIQRTGVTAINFVPSMLRVFLTETGAGACPTLRHVMCAGEALSLDLQELFFQGHDAELHNLYGPTETIAVTHWTCRRGEVRGVVPIGRPVANTEVYVLDARLQPVPVGVPGELYIGGVQVGRGYHGRPELTAQRFIADPFSGGEGARLYKTGDLCRWLEDGTVEFLGRMDFQVKLRGFRIELGEVETALAAEPVVGQCVVLAREDVPGDKQLVAYVVVREGQAWDEGTVRAGLRARMPEYMVPSAFVPMERLPLNANGKVDRKALPRPAATSGGMVVKDLPGTDMEKRLAEVWQGVLRVQEVGVHDNFFGLGGNSLKAMELATALGRTLGRRVPVLALYQAPTISRLVRLLETETGEMQSSGVALMEPDSRGPSVFCLHSMPRGLAHHLRSDCRLYGVHSPLDDAALKWLESGGSVVTVEDIARRYVGMIRAVQPKGPYHVVGFSFGGSLAFEVALQLLEAGERVGQLCLLDSLYAAGTQPARFPLLRKWVAHAVRLARMGPRYLEDRRAEQGRQRETRKLNQGRLEQHANPEIRKHAQRIWETRLGFMTSISRRYVARPYPGDVLVVRSTAWPASYDRVPEWSHGWSRVVAGTVQVVDVNCRHMELMQPPHVEAVARAIRARLVP